MKKAIFLFVLTIASMANAKLTAEDVVLSGVGGIFDLILDKIDKDQNYNSDFYYGYGPGVILKDQGDVMVLGKVKLDEPASLGTFTLPPCKKSPNTPVTKLFFRVKGSDAFVGRVGITYQNGEKEVIDVQDTFAKNTTSGAFRVDGGKRCIKTIAVRGRAVGSSSGFGVKSKKPAVLTFAGVKAKGFYF